VYYALGADDSVAFAEEILGILTEELRNGCGNSSLIAVLTACTHPRRIAILASLQALGSQPFGVLAARTRISHPALSRHLAKLVRRGVVTWCDDTIHLQPPATPLAAVLLRASLAQGGRCG
jgi:hypothetical protein